MKLAAALALILAAAPALALDGAADRAFPNGISGTELNRIVAEAMQARGMAGGTQIAANRSFPPCDHLPEMRPANNDWSLIRMSCEAPRPWVRHLRSSARGPRHIASTDTRMQPSGPQVVKLSRSLKRGAVITGADIELAASSSGSDGLGAFSDPSDVIGRTLTANVGEGRILLARQLEQNWLITRDIPVEIGFQDSAVSVSMPGIALENGQLGELIEVRNTSSGRILRAIVAGPQKVQINAKTQ